jgi:hypothetical protein
MPTPATVSSFLSTSEKLRAEGRSLVPRASESLLLGDLRESITGDVCRIQLRGWVNKPSERSLAVKFIGNSQWSGESSIALSFLAALVLDWGYAYFGEFLY